MAVDTTDFGAIGAIAVPKGRRPVLANCQIDELSIDATYQRELKRQSISLVRDIARNWNWALCNPLVVGRRCDDSLWVVDGQHRVTAAKLRGDIHDLPCVIVAYPSVEAEAQAFVALNTNRRPLTPFALFKAAIASGDAQALALESQMARYGFSVASGADFKHWAPGALPNIGGLRQIFDRRPDVLERVFALIRGAFGPVTLRYGASIVGAIDGLLTGYEIDDAKLLAVLKRDDEAGWVKKFNRHVGNTGMGPRIAAIDTLRREMHVIAPHSGGGRSRPRKDLSQRAAQQADLRAAARARPKRRAAGRCPQGQPPRARHDARRRSVRHVVSAR